MQGVALESLICKNRFFLKPGAHAHNFLKIFFYNFFIISLMGGPIQHILFDLMKDIFSNLPCLLPVQKGPDL